MRHSAAHRGRHQIEVKTDGVHLTGSAAPGRLVRVSPAGEAPPAIRAHRLRFAARPGHACLAAT